MQQRTLGDSVLILVTFFWGMTFPLIENAVKVVNPFVFVSVRFLLAAFMLLPFIWKELKKTNKESVGPALILGLLNVLAYNAQSIGLETLSAAQGAFITGVSVVMVPFLLPFFRLGKPHKLDVVSALFCLVGLFLLTGADFSQFNRGCLWTLLCACSVAISIVYLQKVSVKNILLNTLAFYQILFTALLSFPFSMGENYRVLVHYDVMIALIFCALFATSISLLLQTKYQRFTTASRAAMIFCLEPLFAGLFGYLLNGETLGMIALLGGILIMVGLVVPVACASLGEKIKDV